ncbi:MAG: ATPase [Cellvibrio sp.]|jgi:hypothetical protein|nr:ATPase [Cellvibrio sp.]
MYTETLRDALEWTSKFHSDLHDCMVHCSSQASDERSALLLDYLAKHEEKLARLVAAFEQEGDTHALNTWCREHFNKKPVIEDSFSDRALAELTPDELIEFVALKHSQIIDLYKTLLAKAPIPGMTELLTQLVELEEHEIMTMMQGAHQVGEAY